jgi:hypothetical protein
MVWNNSEWDLKNRSNSLGTPGVLETALQILLNYALFPLVLKYTVSQSCGSLFNLFNLGFA